MRTIITVPLRRVSPYICTPTLHLAKPREISDGRTSVVVALISSARPPSTFVAATASWLATRRDNRTAWCSYMRRRSVPVVIARARERQRQSKTLSMEHLLSVSLSSSSESDARRPQSRRRRGAVADDVVRITSRPSTRAWRYDNVKTETTSFSHRQSYFADSQLLSSTTSLADVWSIQTRRTTTGESQRCVAPSQPTALHEYSSGRVAPRSTDRPLIGLAPSPRRNLNVVVTESWSHVTWTDDFGWPTNTWYDSHNITRHSTCMLSIGELKCLLSFIARWSQSVIAPQ